ncbi:formimidoylglutamate deiminase [Sphingobium sp. AP50]|uniref:formimidoylglutamate deiminase n=1 Tax=Sphingobium sp. AP50 TaxID=1884369 RepID=UPI0008C77011|nr:formimidoylglutamate deiminase [Sphingobium sp. AP50]SEJ23617.1 formimidoylglutamate deiminase [Sphingobium sp. AP50]
MTSIWFEQALLPTGWARHVRLTVQDGVIASVEPDSAAQPDDQRHAIGLPGLSNAHSHAFQRAMAGLAECAGPTTDSFWTWRETMYAMVATLTPDDVRAIAAMAQMEMLESGFTRVAEFHYLHHQPDGAAYDAPAAMAVAIAQAAEDSGIGLTLLPVFYAHSGFGGAAPSDRQRRFINSVDSYARLLTDSRAAIAPLDGARIGIAPHSLRAVTPDAFRAILPLQPDGPIHIHIAEQQAEVDACIAWSGARPVAWLLDHMPVDQRWCLVHATHMDAQEVARAARTGAVAGLCPITEANLGDGLFALPDWLAEDGAIAIGSDSNVRIDASEELRLLEYGQRLARQQRNVAALPGGSTGGRLYRAALTGGAQSVGTQAALVAGAPADIVALRPDESGATGDALLDRWIFARGRDAIDTVWRHGSPWVQGGRHIARDAITARFATILRRISDR